MYTRLCNPLLSHSFFLFGARGTGKTRLLKELFKATNCLWIDLLREGELLSFSKSPGELRSRLASSENSQVEWVVIDEVQRAPLLLNEVHSLIEERQLRFALTGSSARKLRRGGANLLAGRALINNLYPLTYRELEQDFCLDDVLAWGSLPAVINEQDPETKRRILQSYVETYLREEIREEQIVRKLDPFARFLEAAAQSNGSIINLSKIGREAHTDAKGVERYFQILEDTLIGFFLEPYHGSIRKRQRRQAKFYFFDIGVKRALEGSLRQVPAARTYEWGKAFENLLIMEAIRLNAYLHADFRFSYFRTGSQLEIDLIAERKGERTWVIEIKSTDRPDPTEINQLRTISNDINNCRPAIFCTTDVAKVVDGIEIFPWQEGLKLLFE